MRPRRHNARGDAARVKTHTAASSSQNEIAVLSLSPYALRNMSKPLRLQIKRVYEPPERSDGVRVLVDRLWPRGLRKEDAKLDEWCKEIAPSNELRRWFGHDPARWAEFQKRYTKELAATEDLCDALRKAAKTKTVTLLYAAQDTEHNNAVVLKAYLESPSAKRSAKAPKPKLAKTPKRTRQGCAKTK